MENFSYHEQLKREMEERQKPKLNFTFRVHNLYSLQCSVLQAFLDLNVK